MPVYNKQWLISHCSSFLPPSTLLSLNVLQFLYFKQEVYLREIYFWIWTWLIRTRSWTRSSAQQLLLIYISICVYLRLEICKKDFSLLFTSSFRQLVFEIWHIYRFSSTSSSSVKLFLILVLLFCIKLVVLQQLKSICWVLTYGLCKNCLSISWNEHIQWLLINDVRLFLWIRWFYLSLYF